MSCANGTLVTLKSYNLKEDPLNVTIYYSTQQGWFFLGILEVDDKQTLIIKKGQHLVIPGFGSGYGPTVSGLSLKIEIPGKFKLNGVEYYCE